MKSKRSIAILILTILTVGIFVAGTGEIKNIKNFDSGNGSEFFLLIQADSNKSVVKTNREGKVIKQIKLPKEEKEHLVNYVDIEIHKDKVYILGYVGESIYSAVSEKIFIYNEELEKIDTRVIAKYDKPSECRYKDIHVNDDDIYVLDRHVGNVYNITTAKYVMPKDLQDQGFSMAMKNEREIFISTLQGRLYKYDGKLTTLLDIGEYNEKMVANFLNINNDSKLCFLNSYNQDYFTYQNGKLNKLISISNMQGENSDGQEFTHIKSFDNDTFMAIEKTGTGFMVFDEDVRYFVDRYHYGPIYYLKYVILFAIAYHILINGTYYIYQWIFKKYKKIPIVLKQSVLVLLILLILFGVSGTLYIKNITSQREKDTFVLLASIAIEKGYDVDMDELLSIDYLSDYGSKNHRDLMKKFRPYILEEDVERGYLDSLYFHTYVIENSTLYIGISTDYMGYTSIDEIYGKSISSDYYKAIEKNVLATGYTQDINGQWMVAIKPIRNQDGNVIGLYEVGIDYDNFKYVIDSLTRKFITISIVAIIVIISLTIVIISRPLRYLKKLSIVIDGISSGDLSKRANIDSKDEFELFARLLNRMSDNMKKFMDELFIINKSYSRFLPNKYLELLNKKNVIDVSAGDNITRKGYILEVNTPGKDSKSFDEINIEIATLYEIIKSSDGIIVKHFESKLQLFFQEDCNIYEVLRSVNIGLRKMEIDNYKIIVDFGEVNFGIVGNDQRLFATVLSDQIRTIEDIFMNTNEYVLRNIVTSRVIERNLPLQDTCRLFYIFISNKGNIKVYENFFFDEIESKKLKTHTKDSFEKGIEAYFDGEKVLSQNELLKVLKVNPEDSIAKDIFFRTNM